ncbi:tyrosine protein phosphatase [Aquibacillus halophilus]|uniref:Tyrosine-protein phosphatase n=1 Tax=Aquibacillus halophilus TaxID=930132 RepID=A0A6A8D680_9BACI|nr:CpsB/CapC family capsule biosynthesis tyrosine phosphatase [Aquibacillus halophilus]MRH41243.1 tyrosine protein phosphatase [Aquibacillus halophilus]
MIDIHSHILPAIDDGAKHMEESLAMARTAADQGIHTIIAAPHHMDGRYHNFKMEVIENVKAFNERLVKENIPVTVLSGQETRMNGELMSSLEQGNLLPLDEISGYLLLELPTNHVPRYASQLVFELQMGGYRPILAHPERNRTLIESPNQLYNLVKNGAFASITAGSIVGQFGKKVQKFSHQLIEADLVHFVATAAKNKEMVCLKEAYKEINKTFGRATMDYFIQNTKMLKSGDPVIGQEPHRIKKNKIFGII